jgi:ubiquinone/menaquinone biosynthesis C-methylase UbiE
MDKHFLDQDKLGKTQLFWNSNPCGTHEQYIETRRQRYLMEPYLPKLLSNIAEEGGNILEVGCGQGVDAIEICRRLNNGSYIGIDYSQKSVENAKHFLSSFGGLNIKPKFIVGNAENLEFIDNSFDALWSMGVIHHTPNIQNAISEIRRVLKPGKTAQIMIYRKFSAKVQVALLLRRIQSFLDIVFRTDRIFYKALRANHSHSKKFGTMFLECFGVPILNSYTNVEVKKLFLEFTKVTIEPYGNNLGSLSIKKSGYNFFGYLWLVTAKK